MWEIQLAVANNFILHRNMINDEADDVTKELFDSFKNKCQNNLELMTGSKFVFDYVYLLYYKCHKINPNRGRSYTDSLDRIKKQKRNNKSYQ